MPQLIMKLGKVIKKKYRQMKRVIKFGSKNYLHEVLLPDTQFKIAINPSQNACVDETIAIQGYWEKEISEQLTKYIKPNHTFIDIGSNIGYHALFVASLLKDTGQVFAFEPIKRLSDQIKESVAANQFNNVVVYQVGLGDKEDTADIYLRDENMGGSSLSEYQNLNIIRASSVEKISIKTLDSLLAPETQVGIIKIDVEGYEFEALKGAEILLRKQKPIIFMEFSPIFYNQAYPEKAYELIEFLEDLGYSFETISGTPLNLKQWLQDTENPSQIDVICK